MKKKLILNETIPAKLVKFGTSGVRALNENLTDRVCYLFTLAFISYLQQSKIIKKNSVIAVAGDLRPNTNHISHVIYQAMADHGYQIAYLGNIPTPALSYYCLENNCPGIMVTGSHIPVTMNGMKFYKPTGEILKEDEKRILQQAVEIDAALFNKAGKLKAFTVAFPVWMPIGFERFVSRYAGIFPRQCLQGMRVGIYQHSCVTYPLLKEILHLLGAEVITFGRTNTFYGLDTEALNKKDISIAKRNIKKYKLDVIVSTDGDGDRPLISDGKGNWIKGDVVGLLCCLGLNAQTVVMPISCNESVKQVSSFKTISQTKIGSPFVIEKMDELAKLGKKKIIGFEANGGVLLGSDFKIERKLLTALPTRDSILPIVCLLNMMNKAQTSLAQMIKQQGLSYTTSSSIKEIESDITKFVLQEMINHPEKIAKMLNVKKKVVELNHLDGLRIYFNDNSIVHLRPSGNAPELRCYTEARTEKQSLELNKHVIKRIAKWVD